MAAQDELSKFLPALSVTIICGNVLREAAKHMMGTRQPYFMITLQDFSRAAASISSVTKRDVNWAGAITRCSLLLLAKMLPQEAVCPVMLKMKVTRTFLILSQLAWF